jgi:hypothetical protein
LLALEESDRKIRNDIYGLLNWYTKLPITSNSPEQVIVPLPPQPQYVCEHCHQTYKSNPVQGGYFRNSKFCSHECRHQYENINGLL